LPIAHPEKAIDSSMRRGEANAMKSVFDEETNAIKNLNLWNGKTLRDFQGIRMTHVRGLRREGSISRWPIFWGLCKLLAQNVAETMTCSWFHDILFPGMCLKFAPVAVDFMASYGSSPHSHSVHLGIPSSQLRIFRSLGPSLGPGNCMSRYSTRDHVLSAAESFVSESYTPSVDGHER
jgi:hypothetical protein